MNYLAHDTTAGLITQWNHLFLAFSRGKSNRNVESEAKSFYLLGSCLASVAAEQSG